MSQLEKDVLRGNRWPSRTLAFASALVLIPVTWMFLLQLSFKLIFTGSRFELIVLFGMMALMTLMTAEFSRRLANRLLWLNKKPRPAIVIKKPKVKSTSKEQRPRMSRQRLKEVLPFCEKRATGNRVIVEAHAFRFGNAKKHFRLAPWYRN